MKKGAIWEYKGISLELIPHLVIGENRYTIPTYANEGWGHLYLKIIIAVHLLHWGYEWENVLWEYSLSEISLRRRADVFTKGYDGLPAFWFECRTVDKDKLRVIRSALSPNVRLVNVMSVEWFLRWWNGESLNLSSSLDSKSKRATIQKYRADISAVGVEYWAVYKTSTSARILFAVRPDGGDHYTYFDTGEAWSLHNISMLSKRTDCWTPLISDLVGSDSEGGFNKYLPRAKEKL